MNSNTKYREATGTLYSIRYIKGEKVLRDCGRSLQDAQNRVAARLAKRHNKGERAIIMVRGKVIFDSTAPN